MIDNEELLVLMRQKLYLTDQLIELRRLIHMIYQVNEETAREYEDFAKKFTKESEFVGLLENAAGLREANQNMVRILRKEGFTVI